MKFLIRSLLLLLPLSAAAQSSLPPCPSDTRLLWTNCTGQLHFISGEKYYGSFNNGVFHGEGVFIHADGRRYVGEWKSGKRDGQGIEYSPSGTPIQSGQWSADVLIQSFAFSPFNRFPFNGLVQPATGSIALPPCPTTGVIRDCQGATRFLNGDRYQGEWRAGKRNGQGTYTSANGNTYVGEFSDNNHDGWGRLTFANGDVYVGEWVQGRRHGQGVEYASDGLVRRSGQWRAGQLAASYPLPVDRFSFQPASTASVEAQAARQRQQEAQQRSVAALSSPALAQAPGQAEPPRSTLTLSATASQPDANGVVILEVTTNTDTASLKINGDEAGGRADGRYSINRFARVGSNSYEVIAADRFGNTTKRTVVVNREIKVEAERVRSLNPTLISATQARDAVAIIIGIEKYRRVPDADFANNDASAFYDYARRALGIKPENIRLLVDDKADAAEILRAFKTWLPSRVNKNTTDVYVFYSGHGLPSEDGGSLYFLPHEVDRDLLDRTAITQKEIVQTIQRTAPKSVTMFIDSCYSGQSRTGTSLLASARPISIAPKASSDFPPNFMVISASAPDQISSSSPELKHGIFSYYLMLGMEGEADVNKDGQITVGEMQTYLSQRVTRRASGMNRTQSPQTTGDLNRVLVQASSKTR